MTELFFEKYKNPKWQRKRLEIFEKRNFQCEVCGSKSKMLTIHHGYYEKDYEPWDYNDDTLWCCCESCHEEAQAELRDLKYQMAKINPNNYGELMSALVELQDKKHGNEKGY